MPLKNETIIQLKKSELHTQCEICCSSVNMTFDSFLFENCAYRYTNCIQTFFFLLHPKVFVSRTGASIHIREYQAFSDGQFEESCQMQR